MSARMIDGRKFDEDRAGLLALKVFPEPPPGRAEKLYVTEDGQYFLVHRSVGYKRDRWQRRDQVIRRLRRWGIDAELIARLITEIE